MYRVWNNGAYSRRTGRQREEKMIESKSAAPTNKASGITRDDAPHNCGPTTHYASLRMLMMLSQTMTMHVLCPRTYTP